MATGGAHALIRGRDRLKDFYVPLSYGKVRINAPLPAKLFSHIKVREENGTQKGIAVFDVTILDEDGMEIVQISRLCRAKDYRYRQDDGRGWQVAADVATIGQRSGRIARSSVIQSPKPCSTD